MTIEVQILFDKEITDINSRYVATINNGDYKGIVVSGCSVTNCFEQIAISMDVIDGIIIGII